MNIKLFQINLDRDKNRVAFLDIEHLERFQGTSEIDSRIYDKTFEGEVNCNTLEDVFRKFNLDLPDNFESRSLSVSDVVEVVESDRVEPGFYFCASVGYEKVEFAPELTKNKEQKAPLRVVYCEPGKKAEVRMIDHKLNSLQKAVGGDIEAVYPFKDTVAIVCNEEGKFNGMVPNRAIRDEETGEILDIIFGPFFICDCSGQEFASLNDAMLQKYLQKFEKPEKAYYGDGRIISVPMDEEEEG